MYEANGLMCTHKTYQDGELAKTSMKEVDESLKDVSIKKLQKMLIKAKEIKVVNAELSDAADLASIYLEIDIKKCQERGYQKYHIKRKFSIGDNMFEYNIDFKRKKAHFYKSYNKKEYISIREYYMTLPENQK